MILPINKYNNSKTQQTIKVNAFTTIKDGDLMFGQHVKAYKDIGNFIFFFIPLSHYFFFFNVVGNLKWVEFSLWRMCIGKGLQSTALTSFILDFSLVNSIHPLLETRGLYKAMPYRFSARSGVLKITICCVQKLGPLHKLADFYTPSNSQPHSLPDRHIVPFGKFHRGCPTKEFS